MKESLPYKLKLYKTIKERDLSIKAKEAKENKYDKIDFSVEVFNNSDYRKMPDKIGVSVFYPDKNNPTHIAVSFFPIELDEKEFGKMIKDIYKELYKKTKE